MSVIFSTPLALVNVRIASRVHRDQVAHKAVFIIRFVPTTVASVPHQAKSAFVRQTANSHVFVQVQAIRKNLATPRALVRVRISRQMPRNHVIGQERLVVGFVVAVIAKQTQQRAFVVRRATAYLRVSGQVRFTGVTSSALGALEFTVIARQMLVPHVTDQV